MEFIILAVLLILLILVGAIVLGFFYAWCCSQPFVQQLHSEYMDYEKNRMGWNERQLPLYFGTDQSSVAASKKQENEKLLAAGVGDESITTEPEPEKSTATVSDNLEELSPSCESKEESLATPASAGPVEVEVIVIPIPEDVHVQILPSSDNHAITVSVDVEDQKHR